MMLHTRNRIFVLLFAALMTATACAGGTAATTSATRSGAAATATATQDTTPVKIAIVVGVTGSQAPSSANWIAGLGQAVDEINPTGSILGATDEWHPPSARPSVAEGVSWTPIV